MHQLIWTGLLLALWPDSAFSQPYSYIYFKGPGAKEPTFSFNLTHPGDPLPANRNRPLFSAARFAPTRPPVRVVPTDAPERSDGTTQQTITAFTTPPPSSFNVPVFLSEGRFPTSPPRSQRNRASHMRPTENARSDDDAAFLFPTTKKFPAPRSVPPASGLKSKPSPFDADYKPFKFPKGKSGIMVRLPGGASYYVDFSPNVLPNERTNLSPPSTFDAPTSPPTRAVTIPPTKSLTAVTTRSPAITRPFPTAAPPPSSDPGLDDANFLFTPSRTPGISGDGNPAAKRPSKFTRPLPTRSPPKQRFQAGIFFLSNGTISSVPSTRKPFGRANDNFARFNSNTAGNRRTTADSASGFDSDGQAKSLGGSRQRGQLGGASIPIFPNPAAERGRTDDGGSTRKKTVPTRNPDVVRQLRDRLREQNLRDLNDFSQKDKNAQPSVAEFDSARRFNSIDARPVSKSPERSRNSTPSSRSPPPTSSVTDVFTTGRTTFVEPSATRKPTTSDVSTTFVTSRPTFSTDSPATATTARPTRAPVLITRRPTISPQTIPPFTSRRPNLPQFVTTSAPTSPPSTFSPVTFPPVTFYPTTFAPITFRPTTVRPFVTRTTTERFTPRPTTTFPPTTPRSNSIATATEAPTRQPPTSTRRPLTTLRDFAVAPRSDVCPERRFSTRHTSCIPKTCATHERGLRNGDVEEILYSHNKYRAEVATGSTVYTQLPQASDMLLMEWDDELAAVAQAHADLCSFDHDCPSCRRISKFPAVGQNLCLDQTNSKNPQTNWTACITRWFEEASMVRPNDVHPYSFVHSTGHFTQMMWSRTWKIGCGFTMYPSKQPPYTYDLLYTCNYGPAGNTIGENMYGLGAPCAACPKGTKCMKNEFFGLCESQSSVGPLPEPFPSPAGGLLLSCSFNDLTSNDCSVETNGPFVTNAALAIGSHAEVVLKPGQQARLTFKKPIPSENPICVIVNYDIGADESGKTSYGKMTLTVRGKNYEAEGNFGDPNDDGGRKFFYNVDTLGLVKKLELSFVFAVPAGSADTFFDLYDVNVIQDTCFDYYQKNQLRAKAKA